MKPKKNTKPEPEQLRELRELHELYDRHDPGYRVYSKKHDKYDTWHDLGVCSCGAIYIRHHDKDPWVKLHGACVGSFIAEYPEIKKEVRAYFSRNAGKLIDNYRPATWVAVLDEVARAKEYIEKHKWLRK